MCCPAFAPARLPIPRRASVRAAHACRGRGGRGCRCHMTARPVLARPMLAGNGHVLNWHPQREDPHPVHQPPRQLPRRPQAPPYPV